nr:flagellar biosynthetic protein FliR [Salmonella enterica]
MVHQWAVFIIRLSLNHQRYLVFFSQLLTVVFFSCGGMNALITTLYESYVLFPPGKYIAFNQQLLIFIKQQWDLLFNLFLRFSLPAAAIMLLTDVGMGLLNRTAQQLNVFFFGNVDKKYTCIAGFNDNHWVFAE